MIEMYNIYPWLNKITVQVVGDDQITAEMVQKSIESPKQATDVASRKNNHIKYFKLYSLR